MILSLRIASRVFALGVGTTLSAESDCTRDWCNPRPKVVCSDCSSEELRDRERIEAHPICVSSRVWSAGTMADKVYYRHRREGDRLVVGYFVQWSTERPWGDNFLTYSVVPALFVDAFYSHSFFIFSGAREAVYGPGDVEGVSVTYREDEQGRLVPVGGHAEDGVHGSVALDRSDLDAGGFIAVSTDVWSHQLGARGAVDELHAATATETKCFSGAQLEPLPESIVESFRLGNAEVPRRAKPAWRLQAALER